MKKTFSLLLTALLVLSCFFGCARNPEPTTSPPQAATEAPATEAPTEEAAEESFDGKLVSAGMLPLDYAQNFSVELFEGGYRMLTVGAGNTRFLVVPEGMPLPEALEPDVTVLQQPIERVYCASTSMTSIVDAIGGLDNIKLVSTDVSGWYLDNIAAAMENGSILYSGNYKEPDYELMTAQDIQLHIDTTMIDTVPEVLEKFHELGIPSLVETSSQESTPLGRVEWVKLLGVLFGMEAEANDYFAQQKALVEMATAPESSGKTVAMGYITSTGKCYARNGGDYLAREISIAGGEYICADMEPGKSGSTNMSFEDWYATIKDAEYLFYINYALGFSSIQEMIDYNPLFADFKSVQNGNVFITSKDFTQSTAAIGSIIADMHTILFSEDPAVTTDHLIRIH